MAENIATKLCGPLGRHPDLTFNLYDENKPFVAAINLYIPTMIPSTIVLFVRHDVPSVDFLYFDSGRIPTLSLTFFISGPL